MKPLGRVRLIALPVAVLTLTWTSAGKADVSADVARPLMSALEDSDDICQMPPTLEQRTEYQAAIAAYQTRRGASASGTAGPQEEKTPAAPKGWPGRNTVGGNIPPTSAIMDPWPTYDGIAVDDENGIVAMSDENRHGILLYDAASGSTSSRVTAPRGWVLGPSVRLGFVAG